MEASGFIPHDWREWRRWRVLQLKQQGWRQRDLAAALGASEVSVSRGLSRARTGGPEALLSRPAPGHPPELSPVQKRLLPEFLGHGPEADGFHGQVWTCARVAKVIERGFGVSYPKDHVGRWLRELHGTPQMPIRRAIQRDEGAIRRWRDEVWPDLLRRARRERRVLVFEEESGSYLLPGLVRPYAPEAHTPVIRATQTRDHLSVMGGRTPEGEVYTLARQQSRNGWHPIEFLVPLGRVASRRRWVIWDGSPIHRRAEVADCVSEARGQVWVEALPGYAPDLNPWDEGGWNHLQHVERRNLVCRDLEELHEQFHLALGRLRQKPHRIRSFFAQAGLTLEKTEPPLRSDQS